MHLPLSGLTLLFAVAALQVQLLSATTMQPLSVKNLVKGTSLGSPATGLSTISFGTASTPPKIVLSKQPSPPTVEAKGDTKPTRSDAKGHGPTALPPLPERELSFQLQFDFAQRKAYIGGTPSHILTPGDKVWPEVDGQDAASRKVLEGILRLMIGPMHRVLAGFAEYDLLEAQRRTNIKTQLAAMNQQLLAVSGQMTGTAEAVQTLYKRVEVTCKLLAADAGIFSGMNQLGHYNSNPVPETGRNVVDIGFEYNLKPMTRNLKETFPNLTEKWRQAFNDLHELLPWRRQALDGVLEQAKGQTE